MVTSNKANNDFCAMSGSMWAVMRNKKSSLYGLMWFQFSGSVSLYYVIFHNLPLQSWISGFLGYSCGISDC